MLAITITSHGALTPVNACKAEAMSFCSLPAGIQNRENCRFFNSANCGSRCMWYRTDYSGACDCLEAQIAAMAVKP